MITIETYEFTIVYESTNGSGATINGHQLLSNEGLKAQAKRFLKTVYDFSSTLDDLPEERTLSMMLKYYSHCPPEYEPEFFHSAEGKNLDLHATTTTIKLGSVITPELNMHMTFNGLESLNFTDLARVGVNQELLNDTENKMCNLSVQNTSMLCASAKNNFGDEVKVGQTEDEMDINEDEIVNKDVIGNDEMDINNDAIGEVHEEVDRSSDKEDSPKKEDGTITALTLPDQLLEYLREKKETRTADILQNFIFYKKRHIQQILTKLKKEGIINNPKTGFWIIVNIPEKKNNTDTSFGRTPIVEAHVQKQSQDPPPAPRKRDRSNGKAETLEEDKKMTEESRSMQSPDISMKSQVSSDDIEVSHKYIYLIYHF